MSAPTHDKPLRKDAARNREKLLALSDSVWYGNSGELRGVSPSSTYFER